MKTCILTTRCRAAIVALVLTLVLAISGSSPKPLKAQDQTPVVDIQSVTVDRFGVVTISGTVTCPVQVDLGQFSFDVIQPVSKSQSIHAFDATFPGNCDGGMSFTHTLFAELGKFGTGTAYVRVGGALYTSEGYVSYMVFLATKIKRS